MFRSFARRIFWCVVCLLAWGVPCDAQAPPSIRNVHVVLFVVDGCRADLFAAALAAGELPTVQREFVQRGVVFPHALAAFPSATPTGYQSMVSGLFPGHAGIPYLEWFDREQQKVVTFLSLRGPKRVDASFRNHYAPADSRTLFDDLAGHPTAAVYTIFGRGAAVRRPGSPLPLLWPTFISHRLEKLDTLAYKEVLTLFRGPEIAIPRFTFVGLLGTDGLAHKFGTFHPRGRKNLQQFDAFLREFLHLLNERRLLERTYLVITGDHGMHDIGGVFHLPKYLAAHGLRPFHRGRPHRRHDVYVGVRGIGSATLSFPGAGGWRTRPTFAQLRRFPVQPTTAGQSRRDIDSHGLARGNLPSEHSEREGEAQQALPVGGATQAPVIDLVDLLLQAPEVQLVAAREDADRVGLFQRDAEARITRIAGSGPVRYAYRHLRGPWDPLGFVDHPDLRPYLQGRALTPHEWAARTRATDTPDAVVQLAQIFDDGRAGDIVVISTPQWGFYREKAATHGSHLAADMRVPLLIRGPTVRPGHGAVARLVDLYPTMRQWFGLPAMPAWRIDGEALTLPGESRR